jgi:isomerase DpgB
MMLSKPPTLGQGPTSPTIRLDIDGNAPLSDALTGSVDALLNEAEDLGDTALVFIHVRSACNGAARQSWPGPASVQSVSKWERAVRRLERTSVTTAVLAEHHCSSLALDLWLAVDLRLASTDLQLRLCAPGEDSWPGMSLYRLAQQIGHARTRRLLLVPELSAAEAVALDIADHAVCGLTDGLAYAERVLAQAPLGDLAVRRRLLQDTLTGSFDDALGLHLAACDRALRRARAAG